MWRKNKKELLLIISVIVMLGGLIVRAYQLHAKGVNSQKSTKNSDISELVEIKSRRGCILSSNDVILARDMVFRTILLNKYWLDVEVKNMYDPLAYKRIKEKGYIDLAFTRYPNNQAKRKKFIQRNFFIARRKILQNVNKLKQPYIAKLKREYQLYLLEVFPPILGISKQQLQNALNKKSKALLVLKKKFYDGKTYQQLLEFIKTNKFKLFQFKETIERFYPKQKMASHVVGFHYPKMIASPQKKLTKVQQASSFFHQKGIELSCHEQLQGVDGHINSEYQVKLPQHGQNVWTTIDLNMQKILVEELQAAKQRYQCQFGCGIIMDPVTGDILALANIPDYNPNNRGSIGFQSYQSNFAIGHAFEVGSTFKIIPWLVALETNNKKITDTVFCHYGKLPFGKYDITDVGKYGDLTCEQVIVKSSNIGMWQLTKNVPAKTMLSYIKKAGFTQKTGIQLDGEQAGYHSDLSNKVTFASTCRGYSISITALQIAAAYAMIANGGKRVYPNIIQKIGNGEQENRQQNKKKYRVFSHKNIRLAKRALIAAVAKGTGSKAQIAGIQVAGKTGTSARYFSRRQVELIIRQLLVKLGKKEQSFFNQFINNNLSKEQKLELYSEKIVQLNRQIKQNKQQVNRIQASQKLLDILTLPTEQKKLQYNTKLLRYLTLYQNMVQKNSKSMYDRENSYNSFVGFFPADKPKFVCYIMLADSALQIHPKTNLAFAEGGGSIAAPTFRRVAERLLHLNSNNIILNP